jgi:hypothetical protein
MASQRKKSSSDYLDDVFDWATRDKTLIEETRKGWEDIAHGKVFLLNEVMRFLKQGPPNG